MEARGGEFVQNVNKNALLLAKMGQKLTQNFQMRLPCLTNDLKKQDKAVSSTL